MNPIDELTKYFKEFPGIGERQAKRFVYFLLHKNKGYVNELSKSISKIKDNISQCKSCYIFFESKNKDLCETCSDPETDNSSLLVVEKDADFESIRRSKNYKGKYFILGGLIPIVTKETPKFVRVEELLKIIKNGIKNENLKEVILALSLNPQGEHTDLYLREILSSLKEKHNLNIVSLGKGLSTGTELEYLDSETIKHALESRN
ncbi:MAG: toprim domain-containing protein [Patescibacteria group bacterium]|nr:toprim domain-containing protein [Patescibacteria group bacterium]